MDQQQLKEIIAGWEFNAEFVENRQNLEVIVTPDKLMKIANKLKTTEGLKFDYLIDATAVDWKTHYTVVYHLTSSDYRHVIVLKSNITDRDNPSIDSLSALWATAEFQEREIFDLFGIKFTNHPDLRRLFLDDDWGFPLRKDYTDSRIKELK
jgi:NADH:ubiquinone oxidoreductase subunit C